MSHPLLKGKHLKWLLKLREGEEKDPSIRPVLRMRSLQTLLQNFGPSLREHYVPSTGRLHGNFKVAGAKTGRLTCSDPTLQNLPAVRAPIFKQCFIAAPGKLLVGGDYSQVELRIVAHLYDIPALTEIFSDPTRDLHAETAARMLGVSASEVTKEQRTRAKITNFSVVYGAGPKTIAENAFADYGLDMTEQEAADWKQRIFNTYTPLEAKLKEHYALCQRRRYIEIGSGRLVLADWEVETGRQLTPQQCNNVPVQGGGADLILQAMIRVEPRLVAIGAGLVASVHDELLAEAPEDKAAQAAGILQETMVESFVEMFPGAPYEGVVKVSTGKTWRELK